MSERKQTSEVALLLLNARLSYFYGFEPFTNDDGNESYCTHGIFAPNHPQAQQIQDAIRQVATAQWGADAEKVLIELKGKDRLCLHRGDISKPGVAAYAGNLYISASNKHRPTLVDQNRRPLTKADDRLYSGAWANLSLGIWAQDNKYGKRINASFAGAQLVRDDDRLSGGGRVSAPDEFPVVATDADAPLPQASGASSLV